jgi:hypothetical protein
MDARGCQSALAGPSRDPGGDYLFALQGNHHKADPSVTPSLHQPIAHHLAWRTAAHGLDAFAESHGRPVRRRGWTLTECTALAARAQWPDRRSVRVVETMRAASPGAAGTPG